MKREASSRAQGALRSLQAGPGILVADDEMTTTFVNAARRAAALTTGRLR
ncbi:MAG: hypothetical protein M3312_06680 [Actinomycetota bacterium]|nr:hypothetical protein [Actinomycetota bacterium]